MRLLLILAVFIVSSAQAARVEYQFTGDITTLNGTFALIAGFGSPTTVSGSFVYDTDWAAGANPDHYNPANTNFGISVVWGANTYDSTADVTSGGHVIAVHNDSIIAPVRDQFTYNANGSATYSYDLYFTTTDASFLADNSIPPSLDLSIFDDEKLGRVLWFDGSGTLVGEMEYELTSLTLVPIPAAAWLFGSGLLGLCFLQRKTWPESKRETRTLPSVGFLFLQQYRTGG